MTDPAPAPLLALSGISKSLGGRLVVDDVSLSVEPGELVVLLGPNGAGKTTLLGTACGRVAPDGGSARLTGRDPRREVGARRSLGFVPQELALYPYLTVTENLEVFGRMMGVSRRALGGRVADALAWAGLDERAHDRVQTLSGGMQRRLNIVASLLHRPDLVLLDEPTVGVDVNARERIHELLRRLRAEGLGILLTTHDLAQAATLADRVVFMLGGRIRLEGAPQALIEQVFENGKEIILSLGTAPDGGQRAALTAAGLVAGHGGLTWTGSVSGGYEGIADWNHRLEGLGLTAAEIRVREPSLEGVFLKVTGEELSL
ncbi:MAG: ABC transporter ATP-binding protein [Pseudomonadales bacterium]